MTGPPESCGSPICDDLENCDWPTCVGFYDRNVELPGEMECCDKCARARQRGATGDPTALAVIHVIFHREGPQIVPMNQRNGGG